MTIFNKLIRKCFLKKEIISKEGEVFFRRYGLVSTPICNLYLHNILKSDQDDTMHDHPWNFISLILKGSYQEDYRCEPNWFIHYRNVFKAGDCVVHKSSDAHKLYLFSDNVWTLVFTWGTKKPWGYRYPDGTWLDHIEFRKIKNQIK